MNVKWIADHFQLLQVIFLIVVILVAFTSWKSNQGNSNFKRRESERPDLDRIKKGPELANARLRYTPPGKPNQPPLSLPGIRLHGAPHEVLGIDENSTEAEIMKAYKDAIKLYHPDRIQGEAQSQMAFYQEASAKLNQAKDEMIKALRKK